jgi:hypothetical protein
MLAAACETDLLRSTIMLGVIKVRKLFLSSRLERTLLAQGLRAQVKALRSGVLAEVPGREIVFDAVTQPWLANVVFRALPADEFTVRLLSPDRWSAPRPGSIQPMPPRAKNSAGTSCWPRPASCSFVGCRLGS